MGVRIQLTVQNASGSASAAMFLVSTVFLERILSSLEIVEHKEISHLRVVQNGAAFPWFQQFCLSRDEPRHARGITWQKSTRADFGLNYPIQKLPGSFGTRWLIILRRARHVINRETRLVCVCASA